MALTLLAVWSLLGASAAAPDSWPFWGGDLNNTRSTSQSLISKQGVAEGLSVAWQESVIGSVSASPLVYGSQVVVPTWAGYLYSLDAKRGTVQWQTNVSEYTLDASCIRPSGTAFTGEHSLIRATPALIAGSDLIVVGTRPAASYLTSGLPYLLGRFFHDLI